MLLYFHIFTFSYFHIYTHICVISYNSFIVFPLFLFDFKTMETGRLQVSIQAVAAPSLVAGCFLRENPGLLGTVVQIQ